MAQYTPTHTYYPDDDMMSDDSDGISFPAVYSGQAGRMPDNLPGPTEHVTMRRRRVHNPVQLDPRENVSDRLLTRQEWQAVRDFEHDYRLPVPVYKQDTFVQKGPAKLTISGGGRPSMMRHHLNIREEHMSRWTLRTWRSRVRIMMNGQELLDQTREGI